VDVGPGVGVQVGCGGVAVQVGVASVSMTKIVSATKALPLGAASTCAK
jgi:hypothetical protein